MATVMLNGDPIGVGGHFPRPGDTAHSFMLVDNNLRDVSLSSFTGQRKVVVVVPSLDTEIGLRIARHCNQMSLSLPEVLFIIVSVDTPYAQARVAHAERWPRMLTLSTLRGRDFHKDYGVMITDIPLSGMMASAVVALSESDVVLHSELVSDINGEPNYGLLLKALRPEDQEETASKS